MICKVCGRKIENENANFCEYCGASFRQGTNNKMEEDAYISSQTISNGSGLGNYQENMQQRYSNQAFESSDRNQAESAQKMPSGGIIGLFSGSDDKPITFSGWMMIYLIPFIPILGYILFPALLISWSFGSKTCAAKRNWARATLAITAIMIVLFILMMSSGFMGQYADLLTGM